MSAVVDTHGHEHEHGHGDHHGPYGGVMRWITTTNHKDIGTLYLWFSFIMFMVGGGMAMAIRLELFQPGIQFFNPDLFNQFTTMHGLIMVFGAIMPPAKNMVPANHRYSVPMSLWLVVVIQRMTPP